MQLRQLEIFHSVMLTGSVSAGGKASAHLAARGETSAAPCRRPARLFSRAPFHDRAISQIPARQSAKEFAMPNDPHNVFGSGFEPSREVSHASRKQVVVPPTCSK